jgi:hypothetical protein
MTYVVGAGNLSPAELISVKAMEAVGSSSNVNIVVELQTAVSPVNPAIDTTFGTPKDHNAKRFLITKDPSFSSNVADFKGASTTPPTITSSMAPPAVVSSVPVDTTTPGEIGAFVSWARKNYPAQHYALIVCDHGCQWLGFGMDDLYPDKVVSYSKLSSFFQAAYQANGNTKFDLVGFDACVMAGVEVDYLLQSYANVRVASEEEELLSLTNSTKGGGWNYTDFLQALVANPTMDAKTLATTIVTDTATLWQGYNPNFTLSAVDLTGVAAVANALKSYVQHHSANVATELSTIGVARAATDDFQRPTPFDSGLFADLGGLVSSLSNQMPGDPDLSAVSAALSQVVLANQHGSLRSGASGVSIFMPLGLNQQTTLPVAGSPSQDYTQIDFATATSWGSYLNAVYAQANSFGAAPSVQATPATATLAPSGSVAIQYANTGTGITGVSAIIEQQTGAQQLQVIGQFDLLALSGNTTASGGVSWNGNLLVLTDGTKSDYIDCFPMRSLSSLYYTFLQVTLPGGGQTLQLVGLIQVGAGASTGTILGVFAQNGSFLVQIPIELLKNAQVVAVRRTYDFSQNPPAEAFVASTTTSFTLTSTSPLNLSLGQIHVPAGNYAFGVAAFNFLNVFGTGTCTVTVQ